MKKSINIFGKYRLYFLRGYSQYFALLISIYSHGLIIYNFSIGSISFLSWINRFIYFFMVFVTLLLLLSIIIGSFDYRKGSFNEEQKTFGKHSPLWSELFERLERIEKRIEELERIFE